MRGTSFVTTTLARSPRFAFNAATAHRRDSGGKTSVIGRTISLGIAQTKGRCMRHGLALGMLALWMRLGRSSQNVPTQSSPLMTLPQEVMTSGRTVEIANGQ
jgi:hypothetical protein